jgi:coenzyme F420-0:L-glutamate ligase/coenzyme F420-1:gamma-L-glutamate ligase
LSTLTLTSLQHIPLIRHGDNLADMIVSALQANQIALEDNDILVLAQKVVSKAEGRAVNLARVIPSQRAMELAAKTEKDARLVELILQESNEVLRTRLGTIIVEHKLGFVCANAGIDHSNVAPPPARSEVMNHLPGTAQRGQGKCAGAQGKRGEGPEVQGEEWVLLLPAQPDRSAEMIRQSIQAQTGKQIGILIIDSHGRAWRNGTVGIAIGIAGLPGLQDLRGKPDLFGFTLQITQVGVADELAAAASLLMGQAAEGTPIVHVRGFPYPLRQGALQELLRPKEQDLFR